MDKFEATRWTVGIGTDYYDYTYDAWGNLLASSGNGGVGASPFLFGGQVGYYDDGSGLVLCGLRWYNPKLGRWLTRDPHRIQRWSKPVRILLKQPHHWH